MSLPTTKTPRTSPPPAPRPRTAQAIEPPKDNGQNDLVVESSWGRFWQYLNGEAGAGYLLSFVIHLVLLGLLAIPVIQELQKNEELTTIIAGEDVITESGIIGDSLNTGLELALPEPSPGTDMGAPELLQLGPSAIAAMDVSPDELEGLKSSAGGAAGDALGAGGGKKGTGGSGNSIRVADPSNAVRAGSFSVWAWPISGKDLKGNWRHDEPGSSPKVGQEYHIVIRFKVPNNLTRIPLHHFSGKVEGTDGYRQELPQNGYYFNARGELTKARTGQYIPVVDGIAELLILVPAASKALVRDTINVKSKTINEEQTIELVFVAHGEQTSVGN